MSESRRPRILVPQPIREEGLAMLRAVGDVEVIDTELLLADLSAVEKRYERVARAAKNGDKELKAELAALEVAKEYLGKGLPVRSIKGDEHDFKALDLLTAKPIVYVANVAEENVALEWIPVSESVLVNADKTHINRLFTNLIQNAMQAVPGNIKAHIEINERIEESAILITIKDNGNGIPASMRSKIFTPNFTTKTSGTGLGLAMCKGIIEQSKGDIWFETTEGEGSTFYVKLPVVNRVEEIKN